MIEMYERDGCGFCAMARRIFVRHDVQPTFINIWQIDGARDEMIARSGGRTTVPQIFIHGEHIGGATDLDALERQGKLAKLLANSAS